MYAEGSPQAREEIEESLHFPCKLVQQKKFIRPQTTNFYKNDFQRLSTFIKVLMSSSSEDEVEVLVKLLEQDTQKLLDQQTLLVSKDDQEAVFTFVPIASSAAKLTIEVSFNFP